MITVDDKMLEMLTDESIVYNYMTAETFFLHVSEMKKLRFSNIELTNDPYEYKTLQVHSKPYSRPSKYSKEDYQYYDEVVKEIYRIRKRMCIGCFCYNEKKSLSSIEINHYYQPQTGYCHSRMWSQYGGDHTGICLAFNKSKLVDDAKKCCKDDRLFFKSDISYLQDQINYPTFEDIIDWKKLTPRDAAIQYYSNTISQRKLLFTKDIDYEREKEYRIAFYSNNNYEYISLDSLRTIIIGDRFPKHLECSICEVGESLGINIYKINYIGNTNQLTLFYR